MTPSQIKKFKQSSEFDAASKKAYPYGFDMESETERAKCDIVGVEQDAARDKWKTIYAEATGDGWQENMNRFHIVCSAENNADDSVIEGCFESESLAYYRSCLCACECNESE